MSELVLKPHPYNPDMSGQESVGIGGHFGRFSLYSTDTEEQMASVDRGLNRCAALLQTLMSPERSKPAEKMLAAQGDGKKSNKTSKQHTTGVSGGRGRKSPGEKAVNPRFPGTFRHVHLFQSHPSSSSTPIKRHVRSKTEPRAALKSSTTIPAKGDACAALEKTKRKVVKAHRRLKTEPGGVQTGSTCAVLTHNVQKSQDVLKQSASARKPPAVDCTPLASEPVSTKPVSNIPTTVMSLCSHPERQPPSYYPYSSASPYYFPMFPYPWHSFAPPPLPATTEQQSSTLNNILMIQSLAKEMMNGFQQSVGKMKQMSGEAGLLKELEGIENAQRFNFERLCQVCHHLHNTSLYGSGSVTQPSATDWLSQLQQAEVEKQQLLERVIKSEGDYSVTRGRLELANKKVEDQRIELTSKVSHVSSLKEELLDLKAKLDTVCSQAESTEEELKTLRDNSAQSGLNLNAKNAALQQQLQTMEKEAVKLKKEVARSKDQLATMKRSLGTAREEIQMTRLSLAEKETELLQAQDKLLGFRQCLAYFISELKKLDPVLHDTSFEVSSLYYYAPQEAVQRLQSLVTDENVEGFLAAYPSRVLDDDTLTASQSDTLRTASFNEEEDLISCSVLVAKEVETQQPDSEPLIDEDVHKRHPDKHLSFDSGATSTHETATTLVQMITPLHTPHNLVKNKAEMKQPLMHNSEEEHQPLTFGKQLALEVSSLASQSHSSQSQGDHFPRVTVVGLDAQSTLTTSSEVEFRKDLASLDVDIARLQTQFRIAMHVPK